MNERIDIKNYPRDFLEELFEHNIRTVYTKIHLLSWEERVIKSIEGIVKDGSYNVDGASNVRRNLNLTFSVVDRDDKLVYEYLTPDKKIQLYFGLKNTTSRYTEEKIIWFNMGIFILTEPSYSHTVGSADISISAQDKMSMLNGTLGGKLPSATSFIERRNGKNYSFPWRDIFLSSAVTIGNENPAKVVIDSVPDYIDEYTQVKSVAGLKDDFIHINAPASMDGERVIIRGWSPTIPEKDIPSQVKFSKGDRLFKLRKFGPPDPSASTVTTQESYQKNIGETVSSVFDDIVEAMNNTHEYFYTRDGDLVFQPIQNFVNQVFDPEKDTDLGYFKYELSMEDFIPNYLGLPFTYNFADKKTVARYTNNPTFTNIKNDFIAVAETGEILEVAIDHRPSIKEITDWFEGVARDFNMNSVEMDFLAKDGKRREPYNKATNTVFFEYSEKAGANQPVYVSIPLDKIPWQIGLGLKNYYIRNIYGAATVRVLPRWGLECESMIFKYVSSENGEALIPNTGIFNPANIASKNPWLAGYPIARGATTENDVEELDRSNPIFTEKGDSSFWTYFLDIIPTESELGKFSIELLGRRSVTVHSKEASTLFRTNAREMIVITERELSDLGGESILEDLESRGQAYVVIKDLQDQFFVPTGINEKRNQEPYARFEVSPNLEKLDYVVQESITRVKKYPAGGKYSGRFSINKNSVAQGKDGTISISPGTFIHPREKKSRSESRYAEINTPFTNSLETTTFAFLVYIDNKSRVPNSGDHGFFIVAKVIGDKWYYAKTTSGNTTWADFTFDTTRDVIVGVLEHNVYSYGEDSEKEVYGDPNISDFEPILNIRDSNMENLFSVSGAVDLFSHVRTLLYQHTNTADVISLEVLPVYNLEPNTLIYVENEKSNIKGMFMITSYSLSLGGGPMMNISAIQTNPRI